MSLLVGQDMTIYKERPYMTTSMNTFMKTIYTIIYVVIKPEFSKFPK